MYYVGPSPFFLRHILHMDLFNCAVEPEWGLVAIVETGEPSAMPMSKQSFAVNSSGALVGTSPSATTLPSTIIVTFNGPPGLGTT